MTAHPPRPITGLPGRIAPLLLALLLVALPAGAQEVVFHADFNADTLEERPNPYPPGDPEDDYLLISDGAPGDFYVRESVSTLDGKVLHADRENGAGGFAWWAVPPEDKKGCRQFTMEWTMVFDYGVFFLSTAVRGDSTGAPIYANINYRLGAELEINGKTVPGGYPIDVPVTYRMEMDWDTRLWTFFIDDVAVPEATDEPFGTNSEAPIRGLSFSFGGQSVLDVGFDDITIWASECPTPVEPSTWGRMKAAYRSP